MTAPWLHLSRWRALPWRDGWIVQSETGQHDPAPDAPLFHQDHQAAQVRADTLNHDEAAQMRARLKGPR